MTFEELRNKKPTTHWLEFEEFYEEIDDEEDIVYTEENMNATNEVLDAYTYDLEKLGSNPSEEEIMDVVKKVVIRINELNEKYEDFIETIEREDLYVFIDTGARIAGLEADYDITEEWREW